MSENGDTPKKTVKKIKISDKKMTISTFTKLVGGVKKLDKKSLIRKYGNTNKSGKEWFDLLVKLTFFSKEKPSRSFLEREVPL